MTRNSNIRCNFQTLALGNFYRKCFGRGQECLFYHFLCKISVVSLPGSFGEMVAANLLHLIFTSGVSGLVNILNFQHILRGILVVG